MNSSLKTTFAAVVICLFASEAAFSADTFVIDPEHTSVVFGASHMGFSYVYGRFNKVSGGYVLEPDNPEGSQFELSIDAASVDTNNQKRDDHLRSPDFFNVKQFPEVSFQSTGVKVEKGEKGPVYNITGDLTIHGVTRQVTLPLQKLGEGPGMGGETRSGFLCLSSLKRSEFGMTNMIPGIGDEVSITISFEGVRQDGAAPPPTR
jgi:polyisoprenoid-binding protein YceI